MLAQEALSIVVANLWTECLFFLARLQWSEVHVIPACAEISAQLQLFLKNMCAYFQVTFGQTFLPGLLLPRFTL